MVQKGNMLETMNSYPDSVKVDAAPDNNSNIIIKGLGSIVKKVDSQPEITGRGSFELKVCVSEMGLGCDSFEMVITSPNNFILYHNSGRIKLNGFSMFIENL